MTTKPTVDKLLWFDIETTGLYPGTGSILQVAAIVTDLMGNELADPFERVVRHRRATTEPLGSLDFDALDDVENASFAGTVEAAYQKSDDFVRQMHTDTGLWDRLDSEEAVSLSATEESLLALLDDLDVAPKTIQFAGNSVRFDMNWSEFHLPKLYERAHYRSVDVTCLWTTLERWGVLEGRGEPEFVGSKHNAVDDIRHAVTTYRWLREVVAG